MALLDLIRSVRSLDEFESLVNGSEWKEYLALLAEAADNDEIEGFRKLVADAKNRTSPEHSCPELQTLKHRVYTEAADPEALRPLLARIEELRATLPVRRHERVFSRVETALGQTFSPALDGTGYSNRARRARDLFTEHAGKTKIEGAEADRFGNAAGNDYDLGRDGAFAGLTVHVLHLYTGEGFDFSKPRAAFERKGFAVERRTAPGSAKDFAGWLEGAQQLWLISGQKSVLNKDHVEAIRAFWQRGGGLYVWGDNEPFYADANAVLDGLFGHGLALKGNVPGGKVVREFGAARKGFMPHLVTTGLQHLFEGITVSSIEEKVAGRHRFFPLLYGSAGNLITVVRQPDAAAGAVLIDGAFTRLYCQWDEAGSARYVCNAACFLAAMAFREEEAEEEDIPEEPELPYDPSGAFQGTCDLTGAKTSTWMVVSVREMADSLRNTSDLVLTDPLGFGASNDIFSDHLYGEQMGSWIVNNGTDPFTHKPVVECLPLVDLANDRNRREFTQHLCKCLMGGKYLPTATRLLFFAVVDRMLDPSRKTKHRDAWEYLRRGCLANFTSTADFSEMGDKLPLLDAMTAYFSPATDPMVQVRKSFETVGVIGRTLLQEGRAKSDQVRQIARRSLVKSLVADAVARGKSEPERIQPALLGLLFANFHGIPTLDGGRVVEQWPAFARDLSSARQRLERSLEKPLLSAQEQTAVLHALTSLELRQYTAESAVERLLADETSFAAVWNGKPTGDTLAKLNARFQPYRKGIDWADPHHGQVPPFATTFGPSVYRCVCGEEFADPAKKLTDANLLSLGLARKSHFQRVYRAQGEHWYPAEGTLHCNLHRAVQRVVKEKFTDATEIDEQMVPAVAAYLLRDGKGFICSPRLEEQMREVLSSYLALRHAGQPHPDVLLTLRAKAEQERRLVYGMTE